MDEWLVAMVKRLRHEAESAQRAWGRADLCKKEKRPIGAVFRLTSGGKGTRTPDLIHAMDALYQN